jgi:hypothetical protein
MKYACLVYLKEAEITALSQGEWDALNNECMAFGEAPVANVERLGGEALEPTHTATTVRVRNGRVTTTDGPFAETKEMIAGFNVIEAESMDEAVRMAAEWPWAQTGCVEVRPIIDFADVRVQVGAPPARSAPR